MLADQFWRRYYRDYVSLLSLRSKWLHKRRNLKCGDLVLLAEPTLPRSQWTMGRITEVIKSQDNLVRACKVKTSGSELIRPITKLCVLEAAEE